MCHAREGHWVGDKHTRGNPIARLARGTCPTSVRLAGSQPHSSCQWAPLGCFRVVLGCYDIFF